MIHIHLPCTFHISHINHQYTPHLPEPLRRPIRCKGLEPDGSDEVWSAEVIPRNLESEVDEGVGGWVFRRIFPWVLGWITGWFWWILVGFCWKIMRFRRFQRWDCQLQEVSGRFGVLSSKNDREGVVWARWFWPAAQMGFRENGQCSFLRAEKIGSRRHVFFIAKSSFDQD